jgi:hypothetical protein
LEHTVFSCQLLLIFHSGYFLQINLSVKQLCTWVGYWHLQMFRFKLKAIEAHKAWLKSPEVLENCSTGLHFPSEHVENSEVASESHCS